MPAVAALLYYLHGNWVGYTADVHNRGEMHKRQAEKCAVIAQSASISQTFRMLLRGRSFSRFSLMRCLEEAAIASRAQTCLVTCGWGLEREQIASGRAASAIYICSRWTRQSFIFVWSTGVGPCKESFGALSARAIGACSWWRCRVTYSVRRRQQNVNNTES